MSVVVVTGSAAAHAADKVAQSEAVRPLHVFDDGQFKPIEGFDEWDELGLSTACSFNDGVVLSTRSKLVHTSGFQVPDLADIHELSVIDGSMWIPSTGSNELVRVDPDWSTTRVALPGGYHHANQVFKAIHGQQWTLVHHSRGRQLMRRVRGRLLKHHGDGGLVGMAPDQAPLHLELSAPHSVRIVGDDHWVLDSGRAQITRFDDTWNVIDHIPVAGWARGAVVSDDGDFIWIGLSRLRRRYVGISEVPEVAEPEVHVYDTTTHRVVERFVIEGLDQINGVTTLETAPQASDFLGEFATDRVAPVEG